MIQRKQSIWLFLAALLGAGVFFFDIYTYHTLVNGADVLNHVRVADDFVSLLLAMIMTVLPLVAVFMFANRKRQIRFSLLGMLSILLFIGLCLWRVSRISPPPANGSYWIGAVLPVVALVFMFMALGGIRSDEKLVKSADRLR